MSLLEELERLNEGLTPEDLLKLDEKRGIAEQTARWERINSGQPSHSGELTGGPRMSGKGSWYSQLPQYGWIDREDKPGSNALGVKDEEQGIALPSRKTLGQWFDVTFPNGETHRLQQTDVGPAQWTGKGIDISAAAAHKAGYKPDNFPTGGGFTWSPAEGPGGGKPPEETAATFDPTGRKRMANGDGAQGILGALGMQNQQPQGLLGALGDPETMAYIGMMLKGLSPYSNIDPNAMLSSAHTNALRKQALMQQQAEQARDNARADEALNLRRQEFGDARTERQAREADRMRLKQEAADLAASQRKRDAEAFSDLTGRSAPDAAAPDAAAPFAPMSNDDKIAKIDQRLAQGGLTDAGEKQLLRLREQYSKGPSATQLNILKKDEDAIPVYDDIGRKLDRALELAPKVSTGLKASAETTFGPMLGGLAPQQTQDTINFRNITQQFAIENMSQTMKGATSDKEMFKNLAIAADERNSIEIRTEALKRAKDRNDQLKEVAATRKKQIEEGTYGRKQKPREESGGGGGSDPLNIR